MNKEEFNKLSINDKIQYINDRLSKGETVTNIRDSIGLGEKSLQREMKRNGYRYDNKTKQYISMVKEPNEAIVLENNTNVLDFKNMNNDKIDFYLENFEVFKMIIDKFKSNTNSNTSITIDLIDDKHLKPKPKGIRINEFVYKDWQEFCDKQPYSKMDLISMALKEYMNKHRN